jgi:hypothetical protein
LSFKTGFHHLVAALDEGRVPYVVGGSFASSHHGVPRATNDADLLVDLQPGQVRGLVAAITPAFYIDEELALECSRLRRSFNVIHMATVYKYDLFVAHRPFDYMQLERSVPVTFDFMGEPLTCRIASAEDTILAKFDWYNIGGRTSDRQWSDISNILAVSGEHLDFAYLRNWAAKLGVTDLLERALSQRDE